MDVRNKPTLKAPTTAGTQSSVVQKGPSTAQAPATTPQQAPSVEKKQPVQQPAALVEQQGPGTVDARKSYAGTKLTSQTQHAPAPTSKRLFLRFESENVGHAKKFTPALQAIAKQATEPPPPGTTLLRFEPGKAALIGLPGDFVVGYKDGKLADKFDAKAIPRQPNLTKEERAWETRFAEKFAADPKGTVAEFAAHVGDSHIYEVDMAKRCFSEWGTAKAPANDAEKRVRAEANTALHATAVTIAKAAFLKRLDELQKLPDDHPEKTVLVTSGGCAAGKGSLTDMLKVRQPDLKFGATWDAAGEGDALENKWIMQEANKRGIHVLFGYVHNNPLEQFKGVIGRAEKQGRMVDVMTYAHSYTEGARNMKAFVTSPEFQKAREKDLVSVFSLDPGKFNPASLTDKTQAAYPEAQVLPQRDGIPAIPILYDPPRVLGRALELMEEARAAGKLPDHMVTGALAGMARRWPELAKKYLPELKTILPGAAQ